MSGNSTSETPDEPDNSVDTSDSQPSESDGVEFDDLPREEKIGMVFRNSGEAIHQLRDEWEEERVQVYFLFYSFAMVGVMMHLLYQGWTNVLIGAFIFYVITILPPLYIYEEETYFQSDKIPASDEE
jgi:hypothetical protein